MAAGPTQQRRVANDRERKRTKQLNNAFSKLQSIIPKEPSDKMSKINILNLTKDYINFLNDILKEDEETAKQTGQFSSSNRQFDRVATDGNRSDSTVGSSSPCSSSYYTTNQLSPTTGDDYEDEELQRPTKRMRTTQDTNLSPHPISPRLIAQQPVTTAQPSMSSRQPLTPNSELVISPLQTHAFTHFEYPPPAGYFQRTDQYDGATTTSDFSGSSAIYSPHHDNIHPSRTQTATVVDTSLLLRSAFREYRLTKRKSKFFKDPPSMRVVDKQ